MKPVLSPDELRDINAIIQYLSTRTYTVSRISLCSHLNISQRTLRTRIHAARQMGYRQIVSHATGGYSWQERSEDQARCYERLAAHARAELGDGTTHRRTFTLAEQEACA